MKKRKTVLSTIFACALLVPCMLLTTACGGGSAGDNSGGNGGNGGGSGAGGGAGALAVAYQTVKNNIGENFEITIEGMINETITKDANACLEQMGAVQTLYYNGGEYSRVGAAAKFTLDDDIANFNLDNIAWNETILAASLLMYVGYNFDTLQGWSSSATTYLARAMTKYSHATIGNVYIDNATGATFKFEGVGSGAMGNFQVTAFSQNSADLDACIAAIEVE